MCGRAYSTYTEEELEAEYGIKLPTRFPKLKPRFNIAPSQDLISVLVSQEGDRVADALRWGLVPFWSKEPKTQYSMINARCESVLEKTSFKKPILTQRCLVPVSGFYEWKRITPKQKHAFKIEFEDHGIFSIAGIYEIWKSKNEDQVIHSVCMLTTEANPLMAHIHDRMPVIISATDYEEWLDPKNQNGEKLKAKFFKPLSRSQRKLHAQEISLLVNSPKNDREEVLEPLEGGMSFD